jgi:hypothetical protein
VFWLVRSNVSLNDRHIGAGNMCGIMNGKEKLKFFEINLRHCPLFNINDT